MELSLRERDRMAVMRQASKGVLAVSEAAAWLGVTRRHMEGDGAVHGLWGRAHGPEVRERVLALAAEPVYAGFGPTLLAEHARRRLGVRVSPETMRAWLTEAGRWRRKRKRAKHRSRRPRRAAMGELDEGRRAHTRPSTESLRSAEHGDYIPILLLLAERRLMLVRLTPDNQIKFPEAVTGGLEATEYVEMTVENGRIRRGFLAWPRRGSAGGMLEAMNSLVQAAKVYTRGCRTTENFIALAHLIYGKPNFGLPRPHQLRCRMVWEAQHGE